MLVLPQAVTASGACSPERSVTRTVAARLTPAVHTIAEAHRARGRRRPPKRRSPGRRAERGHRAAHALSRSEPGPRAAPRTPRGVDRRTPSRRPSGRGPCGAARCTASRANGLPTPERRRDDPAGDCCARSAPATNRSSSSRPRAATPEPRTRLQRILAAESAQASRRHSRSGPTASGPSPILGDPLTSSPSSLRRSASAWTAAARPAPQPDRCRPRSPPHRDRSGNPQIE